MKIQYSPAFLEKTLFEEMRRRERQGDKALTKRYYKRADSLYALPPERREPEFRRLHADLFSKLDLNKNAEEMFRGFPLLKKKVNEVVIMEAGSDEEADLYKKDGVLRVVVRLRPANFLNVPALRRLLQHELTHVEDMLDERFSYTPEPFASTPVEDAIIRDKYRILWDVSVDSRLIRKGMPTVATKESRFREFSAFYGGLGQKDCEAVFEYCWSRENATHPELRDFAKNPKALLAAAGIETGKNLIIPGTPCPVCRFPSYAWAENIEQAPDGVVRGIRQDAPDWTPEQGVCERCFEIYSLRAGELTA